MRVCVIADDEALGFRIRRALGTGSGHEAEPVIRVDQAEGHLSRNTHDVILVAPGRSADEAAATVAMLRDLTPAHVLAVGPVCDPRLVLGVLRGGAADYVDETSIEAELPPAFARLKTVRGGRSQPGRIVAVLGPSGGSGVSTVAANLAVAMARSHERCLAVDLNARTGDLAALFDLRPSHTLFDLCRVPTRIDRVLFEQTLAKLPSGVSLLASPRSYEALFLPEALTRVFEVGRSLFPRIVVDCDPALPVETLDVLRSADAILVVLRLEFNSLRNAKGMLEHLERKGVDPKKFSLVANRVGQPKEIPPAKVEEALGRKLAAKLPDDPKAALGSQNNGIPILAEYPSSRLSKTLLALATTINTALPADAGRTGS